MNRAALESLLTEMDRHVSLLECVRSTPRAEFLHDPRHHLFAERCFQLAIQCLLDVCYHVAARSGWAKPEDGAAAIQRMAEHGVIPKEFADKIQPMVNFRNILVHAYLNINRELVHANLDYLDDFRSFQRHILTYLSITPSP